jgi:hypothetical protein
VGPTGAGASGMAERRCGASTNAWWPRAATPGAAGEKERREREREEGAEFFFRTPSTKSPDTHARRYGNHRLRIGRSEFFSLMWMVWPARDATSYLIWKCLYRLQSIERRG